MKNLFNYEILEPILMLLIGLIFVLFGSVFYLRKRGFLRTPYNGMEIGTILFSSSFLISVLLIYSTIVNCTIQSYFTFKAQSEFGGSVFVNLFEKFSLFIVIIIFSVLLFVLIIMTFLKYFPGEKNAINEIREGNLSLGIISSFIQIGVSIVIIKFNLIVLSNLTPIAISFR